MKEISTKIALGTVQFGIKYGINNSDGIPSNKEISQILQLARESKIELLDTAFAYGDAEKKIAQLANHTFKIVTKFPFIATGKELENQLQISLNNLNTNALYGYLAHNADNILANPHLWKTLIEAKASGKIEKIGYSLYTTQQLEKLLDLDIIPDLVQLPYSILDKKFEAFLPLIKKMGAEIHVRSAFLQGLYFMNPEKLPSKLQSLKPNLKELQECCENFGISPGALALNYLLENPAIDKVVIGVETVEQLKQNILMAKSWKENNELIERVNAIEVVDKELLNPANW